MTNPPILPIPSYPKEFLVAMFCTGVAVAIHGKYVTLKWSLDWMDIRCQTILEIPPHWLAL